MRCRRCAFDRWKERRRQRQLDAEEAERILQNPPRIMEERRFYDPAGGIVTRMVPVDSPVLPGQQVTAHTFNILYERVKALEDKLRRTR